LGPASMFPVGSNGCRLLRGRGEIGFGGVTGAEFRSSKVDSSAESMVSKSGSGLALALGGRGEGLRGPRGRLPEAIRDVEREARSSISVSDTGKNRFVGVIERWLRPLPDDRDDGRTGSGGLSAKRINANDRDMQVTTRPSYIVVSTGPSHEGSTGPLER
jgi:hypothetical protein